LSPHTASDLSLKNSPLLVINPVAIERRVMTDNGVAAAIAAAIINTITSSTARFIDRLLSGV
jgi:hypothetical protein